MKVLLITSRNVYGTSGELRLIKNRTETLLHSYGIETEILLFKRNRVLKQSQEVFDYASFEGFFYNWYNHPFKFRDFLSRIRAKVKNDHFDAVIVSGGFLLFNMVKAIKTISPYTRVIIDIHGTIEELKEFPGKSLIQRIVRRLFYITSKLFQRKAIFLADGFFVVSYSLKYYIQEYITGLQDKSFFIIPCGIRETEVDYNESLKNRIHYRAKYNIEDDEQLFIYSGGVSPWQCIEESVSLFKRYSEETTRKCRLLLLSGNLDYINKFKSENIITDSYPGNMIRKVLCAGDYAFLLRGDYVTNHVAYPNKFLEYVSSGMKVIATENVDDVAMQVREYSVGVIVNFEDKLSEKIEAKANDYLSDIKERNALLLATSFETTLKPFVEFLKA